MFVDDILVYSTTTRQHAIHLQQVLQKLRDNKLFLKRKKCEFGVKEVEYLGHKISHGQIAPLEDKIKSIKAWPTLTNSRQVRTGWILPEIHIKFCKKSNSLV